MRTNSLQLAAESTDAQIAHYLRLQVCEVELEDDALLSFAEDMETMLLPLPSSLKWEAFERFTMQVMAIEFEGLPYDLTARQLKQVTPDTDIGVIRIAMTLATGTLHIDIALAERPDKHGRVAVAPINIHRALQVTMSGDFYRPDEKGIDRCVSTVVKVFPLPAMVDPVQYGDALRMLMPRGFQSQATLERSQHVVPVLSVELEV